MATKSSNCFSLQGENRKHPSKDRLTTAKNKQIRSELRMIYKPPNLRGVADILKRFFLERNDLNSNEHHGPAI